MFGDLIFGTIPFATAGTTDADPYAQLWVQVCPQETDWADEEKNAIPTKQCEK